MHTCGTPCVYTCGTPCTHVGHHVHMWDTVYTCGTPCTEEHAHTRRPACTHAPSGASVWCAAPGLLPPPFERAPPVLERALGLLPPPHRHTAHELVHLTSCLLVSNVHFLLLKVHLVCCPHLTGKQPVSSCAQPDVPTSVIRPVRSCSSSPNSEPL